MKIFAIFITNNVIQHYGRTARQTCRPTVLFVWLGNPIVYKGQTFTWEQGRKLTGINGNIQYTYDGNGMRYKKVVNGATTNFYYNGTQLLIEDRVNGIGRIYYIYGASGISGMVCQEGYSVKTYYFDKNTLGDIIAIRDESGNVVASYKYDAWGNHTVHNEYGGIDYSTTFLLSVQWEMKL